MKRQEKDRKQRQDQNQNQGMKSGEAHGCLRYAAAAALIVLLCLGGGSAAAKAVRESSAGRKCETAVPKYQAEASERKWRSGWLYALWEKWESESETESESESESETETESESETETEGRSGGGQGEDLDREPEQEEESGIELGGAAEEVPGNKSDDETETGSEPGSKSDDEAEEELESEADDAIEGELESASGSGKDEPESEKETESIGEALGGQDCESESERNPADEKESGSSGEAGDENESEIESESEKAVKPESESRAESDKTGEPESKSEKESEKEGEPESELNKIDKSDDESESEPEETDEPGDETENESEKAGELENESENESEKADEPESESEIELEKVDKTDDESESEPDKTGEPGDESESESEKAGELESESESESEKAGEPESESEKMSESDSEAQNTDEPESEAGTESRAEAESSHGAEHESESEPERSEEMQSESVCESEEEQMEEKEAAETETEYIEQTVLRGTHYRIAGDSNAVYRDANDCLWVRAGAALWVEPAAGAGYNQGNRIENIQKDGVLTFRLQKTDEAGKVLAESALVQEAYSVDGEVPQAEIAVSGTVEEGIAYAAMEAEAEIILVPDGKSGLKASSYCIVRCQEDGTGKEQAENGEWIACANNQNIEIQEEGVFQVCVRTEDQVGNLAFAQSIPVCVDRTPPRITIDGVQDQSANADEVALRITCRDERYRPGSLKTQIVGVNQGKLPVQKAKAEKAQGADLEYYDFPHEKGYDDRYCLTVQAEDLAGNRAEKTMEFSVNRFGSVYDLDTGTRKRLKKYYLSRAADIVFRETNIDYVGESVIYCRCNGKLKKLKRGTDYQVALQGNRESWKQYAYTIPAAYFQEEGVYELMLSTSDRAENESDTGIQKKQVAFVLDKTAPGCTVSGIASGEVYDAQSVTALLTPYDNIGLSEIKIYRNSELLMEKRNQLRMEEAVRVVLTEDSEWQTIQFCVSDLAGNEMWSEEVPVFVRGDEKMTPPKYQSVRPSAKELELQKRNAEGKDGEKKAGEPENTASEGTDLDEPEEGQEAAPFSAERWLEKDRQKQQGQEEAYAVQENWLWISGIAVFLLTSAACLAGRRKKE